MRRGGLAVLLLLAGCGRDGANGGVATRDSAGVRVVEVRGTAGELGRRWGRQAVPEFTTAAANGGEGIELFQVRGVHRYPDGRLLIANAGTGELLLLDPRGGPVRRYGRKGRGPGEFTMMAAMWPGAGDSVYVYDLQLARVTPFTPAGGFGSPVALPRGNADGFLGLAGRFADGAYLGSVMKGISGGTATGVVADTMLVVRVVPVRRSPPSPASRSAARGCTARRAARWSSLSPSTPAVWPRPRARATTWEIRGGTSCAGTTRRGGWRW